MRYRLRNWSIPLILSRRIEMAKGNLLTCRVCGKQYKGCKSCEANQGVFHWRNFACSEECARKYINDTIAYREKQNKKTIKVERKVEKQTVETNTDIKKKINNVETATTSDTKKAVKKDEVSNDETSKNTEI